MVNARIYLSSPTMHGEEQAYVKEAFDTNWVAPLGKNVDEFEKSIAEYIGVKEAAALNSGTAALHMAVKLAGVKCGDIVLCSDLTFAATVNPVSYEDGIQVFIDSEPETWNMDPEALEIALRKYNAKAVIVANLYGTPAKLDEIQALCKKYNVTLIEDAAESLGATLNGVQTGTFGKYNALSFNGNKMITTSGGGALICKDAEAKKEIMFYATQAREAYPYYQHERVGYNYRMSNICAGIGRGQMTVANEHIEHHKALYELYCELFSNVDGITVHKKPSDKFDSNFWLVTITLDPSLHVKGEEKAYSKAVTGAVGGAAQPPVPPEGACGHRLRGLGRRGQGGQHQAPGLRSRPQRLRSGAHRRPHPRGARPPLPVALLAADAQDGAHRHL